MRLGTSNAYHIAAIAALFLIILISAVNAADLTITDAWVRAMPAADPSGGYFILHNNSKKDVTLTGASSPACGMLMLHKSDNMGGITGMRDVSEVVVPSGGSIKFTPGGYHLMCMDAKPAIIPGASVPVSLEFKDGSRMKAQFAVPMQQANNDAG